MLIRRIVAGFSTQLVATGASLALQAGHFALLAILFPRGEFGPVVTALALYGIANALADFGLLQTTVVKLQEAADEAAVMAAARRVTLFVAAGAIAVSAVAALVLPASSRTAALALVPAFVVTRVQLPHLAVRQSRMQLVRIATGDLCGRLVTLVLTAPFAVSSDGLSHTQRIAVLGTTSMVGATVAFILRRVGRLAFNERDSPHIRPFRLWMEAMPLGLANAASFVHVRMDQVLLAALGVRGGLASYAVAYRPADAAVAVASALSVASLPLVARHRGPARAAVARATGDLIAVAAVATGIVLALTAPLLVYVLGGGRYPDAAILVRLLVPVAVMSVLNLPGAQVVIAEGGARILLGIALVGIALNALLNLALIPSFGVRGAIAATYVSELVGMMSIGHLARRRVARSVDTGTVLAITFAFSIGAYVPLFVDARFHTVVASGAGVAAAAAAMPSARRTIAALIDRRDLAPS